MYMVIAWLKVHWPRALFRWSPYSKTLDILGIYCIFLITDIILYNILYVFGVVRGVDIDLSTEKNPGLPGFGVCGCMSEHV